MLAGNVRYIDPYTGSKPNHKPLKLALPLRVDIKPDPNSRIIAVETPK